jgi:Zinc dependent phospholipase C
MRSMKIHIARKFIWAIPLSLYALDANAWGLYTHIYFSQYLLLTLPLVSNKTLHSKIRQAIEHYPKLVLAGACLPDLAIVSKAFNTTHQWHISEQMLAAARTEQEMAIAVGYSSHLFVDVIAHNHFVPAHEAKWGNKNVLTHIASEWAMDAYVAKQLNHAPHQLIREHLMVLTEFVAPIFKVSPEKTNANLKRLAFLDQLLRITKLSPMLLWLLKIRDVEFIKNLNYYLAKTEHALSHFHHALQGKRPNWEPELTHLNVAELIDWREQCLGDLRLHMLNPVDFYHASQKNVAARN